MMEEKMLPVPNEGHRRRQKQRRRRFPSHMIFVNRNLDLKCVGGVVFDLQIQPAFRHRRVNSLDKSMDSFNKKLIDS